MVLITHHSNSNAESSAYNAGRYLNTFATTDFFQRSAFDKRETK